MKIAILSPLKQEEAETFIQNHISNLPFEKIVIYGGNFPYVTEQQQPSTLQRIQFKLIQFVKNKLGFKTMQFKAFLLSKILKKENVDMVFAEYLTTGAETVEVCKKLNIPMVAIALGHEISNYTTIKRFEQKYKRLFKYAKHIFIVSNHMRKNIEALGCASEKIIYTPAGPSNDFFKINPQFKSKQILAVGRFVDKKAPHLTIMSFKKVLEVVPNATLVLAGDGLLLNACKDLATVLKIDSNVKFIGKIDSNQHKKLLEESWIFVQHSKIAENGDSEGTPVAILEASAAGLPVVSTLHAGIPDVVMDTKTGYLVPENAVDLMAEKIIYLLQNKELSKEMGTKGKAFVKENFSLDKHIQIIEKYLKE